MEETYTPKSEKVTKDKTDNKKIVIDIAPPGHVFGAEKNNKNILDYNKVETEGKIYIKSFEDIKPSTMTLIAQFDKDAPPNKILYYSMNVDYSLGKTVSLRWDGRVRGVQGGKFRHSVIANVMTEENVVSTKISKNTIHMCGVKSMEMGREVSNHLVKDINEAMDFLMYIRNNQELYEEACEWLISNSVSDELEKALCVKKRIKLERKVDGKVVSAKKFKLLGFKEIPLLNLDIDPPTEYKDMVDRIIYRLTGVRYHVSLAPILKYLGKYSRTLEYDVEPIGIKKLGRSMVNRNYNVGFRINAPLAEKILREEMNFMSDFSNTSSAYIKIKMVSDIPDGDDVCRRVKGHSEQTFLFNPSGCVLHSGQGGEPMKDCYITFTLAIAEIKDRIQENY